MPIFPARVKRPARACPRRVRSSIFLTMTYDFDRIIERRRTESNKWHKYPADVLPLWVADMDFSSPEPVVRALRERVEHGVFGYGVEQPEFHSRQGMAIGPVPLLSRLVGSRARDRRVLRRAV